MSLFEPKIREHDFMSELDAATRMRPATSATILMFSIMALVLFCIVWAGFAKVEELTRGRGKVVPSSEVQFVQSLEGGILEELLVEPGQKVKRDEVLMRLSDIQFSSEERGTEARFLALEAKRPVCSLKPMMRILSCRKTWLKKRRKWLKTKKPFMIHAKKSCKTPMRFWMTARQKPTQSSPK